MNRRDFKIAANRIIFGTNTPAGKLFDLLLIYAIIISVIALMLDSVASISREYGQALLIVEWTFTIMFTIEYAVRLYVTPRRWEYAKSFYGFIDLVSVIPTYLALFLAGANIVLVVRLLRVLRIFRVLKLVRYLSEVNILVRAMYQAQRKILVFFVAVLVLATVFGSIMYVVEGPMNGFTSIPISIYWTIVTITTVGYGDIVPQTVFGKIVASAAMLTGYSIIAVPTGIVTAELANEMQRERGAKVCGKCRRAGHDMDADYCKRCGHRLADASA